MTDSTSIAAPRRTERLALSPIVESDFGDLCAMHSDPAVMRTLGGVRSAGETREVLDRLIEDWSRDGFGLWSARDPETGDFVGRGGVRRTHVGGRAEVEVAYAFLSTHWGIGLATELARESVRFAFDELGLENVVAFTLTSNLASQGVMRRVGFQYERDVVHANLPHVLFRLRSPSAGA